MYASSGYVASFIAKVDWFTDFEDVTLEMKEKYKEGGKHRMVKTANGGTQYHCNMGSIFWQVPSVWWLRNSEQVNDAKHRWQVMFTGRHNLQRNTYFETFWKDHWSGTENALDVPRQGHGKQVEKHAPTQRPLSVIPAREAQARHSA